MSVQNISEITSGRKQLRCQWSSMKTVVEKTKYLITIFWVFDSREVDLDIIAHVLRKFFDLLRQIAAELMHNYAVVVWVGL